MDPILQDYLLKKKAAQEELDSKNEDVNTASLVSNIGDVIAGNRVGSANDYFDKVRSRNQAEMEKNDPLKQASESAQLRDFISKEELANAAKDPNSRSSVLTRAFAKKYGLPVLEDDSMQTLSSFVDPKALLNTEANANVEFNKAARLKQLELTNDKQMAAYKSELEKSKKLDPKQKLMGLSGTDKARFDNAVMAIKGLNEMGQALDAGDNTFSMVGDNNYTSASRRATEAYGRMQSGGAINKDEEARFEKTLPGKLDSKQIQRKKLLDQRNEMISRLKTLGFTPEEAGVELQDFKYGADEGSSQKSVVKRQVNPKTGQVRLVYSDGSTEILPAVAGGK